MSVVRTLRVRVDWVQFPAARPELNFKTMMHNNQVVIKNQIISYFSNQTAGEKCLLFLHGWRSQKEVWANVANKLISQQVNKQVSESANQPISIYAIDLPGFGGSSLHKIEGGMSVSDYALVIKEFIEKLNLKNIILVGHSFGGRVGIKLVASTPSLSKEGAGGVIEKLILVDSAGFAMNSMKKNVFRFIAKIVSPFFKPKFMQSLRAKIYKKIDAEDYLATPELQKTFLNVVNEDLTEDVKKINIPTLILTGENDTDTPVVMGKKMHTLIPDSSFRILPNSGHFSFVDQPEQFVEIVKKFI
jgi:pimeloyl-ACP methyl ester carboxylesterase